MQFTRAFSAVRFGAQTSILLAGAVLLALAGCNGAPAVPAAPGWQAQLPVPSQVAKQPSAVEVRLLPAIDYLDNDADYFQRIVDDDTTKQIVFDSAYMHAIDHRGGLEGLAYCMYRFTLPDHSTAPMIRWQWMGVEPPAGTFFIGLPDRARDTWEWHDAGSEGILDTGSWNSYLAGDELLLMLAVADTGEYRLDWVKVGGPVVQAQLIEELEFGIGWTDAAIVNERPAMVYIDSYDYTAHYVRADDYYGFSWGTPIEIATGVSASISLAVVNSRPAIVYESTAGRLCYALAKDANGSSWNAAIEVTTANDSGNHGSLAIVDGYPAASSMTNWGYDVLYTRANDASGGFWEASLRPDQTQDSGGYTSLAVVDGNPAIAYIRGDDIGYVRATDSTGAAWGTPQTVAAGSWAEGTCLKVVNGYPAISYISSTDVCYIISKDPQGGAWWAPTVMDIGSPEYKTSLAVIGIIPAIAFYTLVPNRLNYVKALDMYGSDWGGVRQVDVDENGEYPTLFEVQGHAGFAYGQDTATDVDGMKYALLIE